MKQRYTRNEMAMTIGELYIPAMIINNQEDADIWFGLLVEYTMQFDDLTHSEATSIVKHNLGYCAGYYNVEIQWRVERLFKCSHPVFGKVNVSEDTSA